MKNITHRTVKSITRNALFISMILHVFFLTALFYFTVRNQPIFPFQDKLDATIETLPKQLSKKPMKTPIREHRKTTVFQAAKMPSTTVETPKPQMPFQPRVGPTSPVITAQPRLKETNTAPDVEVNVSTALRELRQVEDGLSRTEAAQPTVDDTLGSKRSGGVPGVQRTPVRSTLDFAETVGGDGDGAAQVGGLFENKPALPNIQFSDVMRMLGSEIIGTSDGGPIDVVFVIDASGSMGDNIKAVANHLIHMIDVYKSTGIDYALGLTHFSTLPGEDGRERENEIQVIPLTTDIQDYKREIYEIFVRRDENALDAIVKTVNEMRFRATSKKHLILVTDEPFTSIEGKTVYDAIALCSEFGIYVNVLGLPDKEHQLLAARTQGKWHPIPGRQGAPQSVVQRNTASTAAAKAELLRNAQWQNVQRLSRVLLQNPANTPADIVLFIDSSKSMENKLPHFVNQLEVWTRDWDSALIDYQIGVVRFHSRESDNSVNVYNAPQTLEQVCKTIEMPCQDDENLLHAIAEAYRQIEFRQGAKTYLFIVTDEPISNKASSADAVIQFLEKKLAIVSIVGTIDYFQEEVTAKTGGMWVPIPDGHTTNDPNW